jgi:hypothetical protein
MILRGLANYRAHPISNSAMAVVVLAVYGAVHTSAGALAARQPLLAVIVDLGGLVVSTVLALPWFRSALAAEEKTRAGLHADSLRGVAPMAVAAFLFWAGVLVGLRYLAGIPSLFVLIWYGLFGYAVAAGQRSGLRALAASIDLGHGARGAVATMAAMLLVLNLLGAIPIGFNQAPWSLVAALVGLTITTNISIGAGASLYYRLVSARQAGS